ncbi:hypothetical protein OTU49_017376 [Cherax quadricarinatus]|uniref:Uncharacterized protein n=1 Tax=Cherax quadricarinatus TaxID=27406 RepID=A0AAW0XTT3_CHEQU
MILSCRWDKASSSTQKELETHREKLNFEDFSYSKVTMPVGLSTEASTLALPHGQSPSRKINGQDIKESLTDVEDLFSDGDQTPVLKRKALNLTLQKDAETVTDTEDTDLSGEEDDIIKEESNIPTIQDLGLLPEPNKEVINLTEGYARGASPILHSDSEPESEDVQGKHMKNILRVDKMNQLDLPSDDVAEALTDVEDMVASGDEEEVVEAEDSLPEHYMDQSEGVSDREKLKASSPAPKIFLAESEDLSDDDKKALKHNRHKSKVILEVNPQEGGTTDVEDLVLSDKEGKEKPECGKNKKEKIRRKKQIRRKTVPKKTIAAKSLIVLTGDSSGLTDVEILSGDEDEGVVEDEDLGLIVPEIDIGILTDSEDVEVSDTEDVADLMPKPVDKVEISLIPDPHSERVKISEIEEAAQEESGGETEEEGFELNEKDDEKALNPRQTVLHEPIVIVGKETLDADEETYEAALTDTEDLGIDEHEEEELLAHITSRLPEEGDIYTITEMESCSGQITKKEIMKDCQAKQIEDAELTGFFLQEDFEDNAHTDVEDLDDSGEYGKNEVKTIPEAKTKVEDGLTDEESVDESDIEEEIQEPPKQVRKRNKRLPLVPQVSEVRFVETEQGPLSIIITPDTIEKHLDQIMKDQVTNVVFLESEDKEEAITDIEDLSDGEEGKTILNLKLPQNKQEPTTDTEDFDIDPCEMNRPLSPVPPNIKYNVLPSPKRELIQIKEDKYGVPQVTVRKLEKDELFVSDIEDLGATDIEDLDVSEDEALRLVGITEDSTSDFEFPDAGTTEVSTKMIHKIQSVHVEVEEGGGTDIEELPTTRKPRRKAKSHSKLMPKEQGEDSHTDIELLSDQDDKGKLTVRLENPGGNTDVEDFEASETEEVEVPDREDMPTPDIIRDAAIKKMIILKEGPDGTTYTEDAHVAEDPVNFLGVEGEAGGITDVEDMEVSGAEDEIITDHPAVDLPEYEASSVDISETTSLPSDSNEAKHIKDNLLLPEDNFNNLTDVESLGEGEGTHEAGQLVDRQIPPHSHEQASSGPPTSGTKAGPAHGKSNLSEADLAVLESMMVAQEAEVEEMTFTHKQAEIEADAKLVKPDTDTMISDKSLKMHKLAKPPITMEDHLAIIQTPALSSSDNVNAAGRATDTGQQLGDLTKRVADVASTMASTLESITAVAEGLEGSHLSSDEGEEQLMLMRDSPRWEDEEIQAEDTDEPRAIKAEIKLLVKTTELGKESIEIRSIREFVECEDKDLTGFGGVVQSPSLECGQITPMGDRVYTLQRASPDVSSPSPRFVRPQQPSTDSSYTEPTQDEFDLMAQVRDVVQPDSGAGAQQAPGSSEGH